MSVRHDREYEAMKYIKLNLNGKKTYIWSTIVIVASVAFYLYNLITFFQNFFMVSLFVMIILHRNTLSVYNMKSKIRSSRWQ
mgnify:CR=1 FL=1